MSDPRRGPRSDSRLRYAVDETPLERLTLGLSLQIATVILTGAATPSRYDGSRTAPRRRWTSRSSSGR